MEAAVDTCQGKCSMMVPNCDDINGSIARPIPGFQVCSAKSLGCFSSPASVDDYASVPDSQRDAEINRMTGNPIT